MKQSIDTGKMTYPTVYLPKEHAKNLKAGQAVHMKGKVKEKDEQNSPMGEEHGHEIEIHEITPKSSPGERPPSDEEEIEDGLTKAHTPKDKKEEE